MDWENWYSGDYLCVPDQSGSKLATPEILRRVAVGFRRVVIDWTEGTRFVEWRIQKGLEVGWPNVILEAEQALLSRTVLVSVADEPDPDAVWVRFYLFMVSLNGEDNDSLDLNYNPGSAVTSGRALAMKLAGLLGYEFVTAEESQAEEEEECVIDSDFLIHRNGLPDEDGRLPTPRACLSAEEFLSRVANRFPLAIIDRERGDQIVRAGADNLAAMVGPTDPSVERLLAMVGRVAHVTIRAAVGGPQFCFFLNPDLISTGIHIEYDQPEDRNACRPLLKAFVEELPDYYCMSQDLDAESENLDD